MKQLFIYALGCTFIGIAAILILSGHPAYTIAGILFAYALYKSGSTKRGRKFWRAWHRVNIAIVRTYSE